MLQLTKRTEYGLIALVHLADREGDVVSVRELCEQYPLPRRLVAEVLKELCRRDLVLSSGARKAATPWRVPRPRSRSARSSPRWEGKPVLTSCESLAPAHQGGCDVEPTCPIRSPIHRIRERLWDLMDATSLSALIEGPRALAFPTAIEHDAAG